MEYYPVNGTTWSEIYANIRDPNNQMAQNGIPYEGVTFFELNVKGQDRNLTVCPTIAGQVRVKIIIRVPSLMSGLHLNQADLASWSQYDRGIMEHEEGHMRIAIDSGETLLAKIQTAQTSDCRVVTTLRDSVVADMNRKQAAYDLKTDHGMHQERALMP